MQATHSVTVSAEPPRERSLHELVQRLYAAMTPSQVDDFDKRLHEDAARFDAWTTVKGTKR